MSEGGLDPAAKGDPQPKERDLIRRFINVCLLGLGWCLAMSGMFVNISTTTVAATNMANASLSTLPVAAQLFCSALCVVPLGRLAHRFGRRSVFVAAPMLGVVGSLILVVAAWYKIYGLLILGCFLQGPSFAVANNFRFVSAEFMTGLAPEWRARAISLTVGFAVFAAGIGPESVRNVRDNFEEPYAAAYVLVTGLYLAQTLATAVVAYGWLAELQAAAAPASVAPPPPTQPYSAASSRDMEKGEAPAPTMEKAAVPAPTDTPKQRPASTFQSLLRVEFFMPAVAGALTFCNMAALMVATPIAMIADGHSYDESTWTIEAHIVAMFLPAALVGDIITLLRWIVSLSPGFLKHLLLLLPFLPARPCARDAPYPPNGPVSGFMMYGAAIMIVSCGVCMAGRSLGVYMAGLVLLGLGWAWVYVASSSLVTAIFMREPHLRLTVQGGMDTLVVLGSACANAVSGPLVRAMGWQSFLYLNMASNGVLCVWCIIYHIITTRQWHKAQRKA